MKSPDVLFGELFTAIQLGSIFPDSKTFVDCIPRTAPAEILHTYMLEYQDPDFDLEGFVHRHFMVPETTASDYESDPARPIEEHIRLLWEVLKREADQPAEGSSLIPLPYPYVVPGGRFGEIYYWDSYFTILGLLESGLTDLAKHMVANFAHLINTLGHIPNGNRSYFLSRSQPPFFALMVNTIAQHTGDHEIYATYAPAVEKEYAFWMDRDGSSERNVQAYRRTVTIAPGVVLNRYWDDNASPRQESFIEDVQLAELCEREPEDLYRNIRAACESGWDFSSRWCDNPYDLGSIETIHILPVDLNCLLWSMEDFLSRAYAVGQADKARMYLDRAEKRKAQILSLFWDSEASTFRDYNFVSSQTTEVTSLAMMFPLFMQIATEEQARGVARALEEFIQPGGLVTTLYETGQQWDAPNGWAPLHWIAYRGLKNYGFDTMAEDIARRWTENNIRVYHHTGRLVEKYNVEDLTLEAGGGEYPVQDGFGWTNGVLLKLLRELSK